MRPAVFAAAASLVTALALPAFAADDCPGGDWFCDTSPGPEAPPPAAAPPEPPAPGPDQGAPREPAPASPEPAAPSRDDADSIRIDVPRVRPARHRRFRRYREWGLNLHALVGLMGSDAAMSPDADMNGLGGALRFRPIPHIALEGALELAWGTDYNGFQRFEDALLVNGLFFANPWSPVQLYALAGLGVGGAYLDSGQDADGRPVLRDETYAYFGGQLGFGVEARVTRHFALGADLVGFLRSRRDAHAARNPEFVDPSTGRTTNSSGGGYVRLGATFYW